MGAAAPDLARGKRPPDARCASHPANGAERPRRYGAGVRVGSGMTPTPGEGAPFGHRQTGVRGLGPTTTSCTRLVFRCLFDEPLLAV